MRAVLLDWAWSGDSVDSILICTDELVTNAILHACSDLDVVVRRSAGQLRVEVHDRSTRPPLRRVEPIDADSGRGLNVVESLADRWGVSSDGPAGKAVWFELA